MRYYHSYLKNSISGDSVVYNRFTFMPIKEFVNFQNTKAQKLFVYTVDTKRIPRWGQPEYNECATYNGFLVAPSVATAKALLRNWYGEAAQGKGEGSRIVKLQLWAKLSKDERRQLLEPLYGEEKELVKPILNM